jgi:hypothetical protein
MMPWFSRPSAVILFLAQVYPIAAQYPPTTTGQTISQLPATADGMRPVVVEDQCVTISRGIKAEAIGLLWQRKYQALDAMAARLQRDNIAFPNGDSTICFFYEGVSDLPKDYTDAQWEQRIQALRDWFEADAESMPARVALATGLYNYSWKARGNGYADTVTQDGWRQFGERLDEARRILVAAERLGPDSPVYYSTRLRIAFMDGSSRDECEHLFEQCITAFPGHTRFYLTKANFLLPRWLGAPGEWEAFAAASANHVGGEAGDMLYAQIVWSMHDKRIFGNIFRESTIEWPRLQRGFEALCRRYPESVSALSEYCYLAGFSDEGRSLTRRLLQQLGNRVDLSVWKTMDRYLRDRAWTLAEK